MARTLKEKYTSPDIESSHAKRKRRSPDPSKVEFEKAALLDEVNNMDAGDKINLSQLARTYGIPGPLGNMIVREFLEQHDIDLSKFDNPLFNSMKCRRRYNRMPEVEYLSRFQDHTIN